MNPNIYLTTNPLKIEIISPIISYNLTFIVVPIFVLTKKYFKNKLTNKKHKQNKNNSTVTLIAFYINTPLLDWQKYIIMNDDVCRNTLWEMIEELLSFSRGSLQSAPTTFNWNPVQSHSHQP